MGFGALLFSLPILIGQWIGILGLSKTGRNVAWWFMMAGICCSTLGSISSGLIIGLALTNNSFLGLSSQHREIFIATSGLAVLGSLLFAIGFAIHGQRTSNIHQRVTELEVIATAQSEELNRLRSA